MVFGFYTKGVGWENWTEPVYESRSANTRKICCIEKKLFSGGNTVIGKDWPALRTLDLEQTRVASWLRELCREQGFQLYSLVGHGHDLKFLAFWAFFSFSLCAAGLHGQSESQVGCTLIRVSGGLILQITLFH